MARITARIINAFVDAGKGGNPAGVILDADNLDASTKQRIAARIGVSETAFISQSEIADFKLEFFTPTRQIAHCGHATIATFVFLAQQSRLKSTHSSKETIDGRRDIFIVDDMAFMEQTAPKYTVLRASQNGVGIQEVLDSLALRSADLPPGLEPLVVNTGNNFLIIPIQEQEILQNLKPDFPAIEKISAMLNLIGYYTFSTQTFVPGRQASARMFAPWYGIQEEAATGMAAGPLACYLYEYMAMKQSRLVIEQGFMMQPPSPSEIFVDLKIQRNEIESLLAGGRAQVTRVMEIEL
jgi:PhzF family phenazine biosynthesis protein